MDRKEKDLRKLEFFIDLYGLEQVLIAIEDICQRKAEDIKAMWNDERLALWWIRKGRLIAAAPDLLDACKYAKRVLKRQEVGSINREAVELLGQVIAKAEGNQ